MRAACDIHRRVSGGVAQRYEPHAGHANACKRRRHDSYAEPGGYQPNDSGRIPRFLDDLRIEAGGIRDFEDLLRDADAGLAWVSDESLVTEVFRGHARIRCQGVALVNRHHEDVLAEQIDVETAPLREGRKADNGQVQTAFVDRLDLHDRRHLPEHQPNAGPRLPEVMQGAVKK